ncbi:triose-phosphate isomerase [Candidatus Margulisiibacteriota bacterium]
MRTPLLAGNWKLNKNIEESVALVKELIPLVKNAKGKEILVCPAFTSLDAVFQALQGSNIMLGAQNIFWENKGAFTAEISAPMLKSAGCSHVIIGHSERRQYFGETDETVNKRLKAALGHGMVSIVCVGETLGQRENNETFTVIERQIKNGLKDLDVGHWALVVIAYEPVWAIGTGKTASPEQAEEVHAFIRKQLPKEVADKIRILYGGSVKPSNVKELMGKENIDGALVGGASLKANDFAGIVNY